MSKRLNITEKAQLFHGLGVLENKYGKERTEKGIEKMLEVLEDPAKVEQMKFDELEEPNSQSQKKRKRPILKSEAEIIAKELGYRGLNDCLIRMYYKDHKHQYEIGDLFGCAQRTISTWVNEIPKKTLKKELNQ